jgi:hypothetical protein
MKASLVAYDFRKSHKKSQLNIIKYMDMSKASENSERPICSRSKF